MVEVKILPYSTNVLQIVFNNFASFVLVLHVIVEYYDLKSFVHFFKEKYYTSNATIITRHKVVQIFAPLYLLKLQPAVVTCYCMVAGLYGILKKKRYYLTPYIVLQFLTLVKVTGTYILWFLFGKYEENLLSGSTFWAIIYINWYTVLSKDVLQWSIASGFIIEFGVCALFLSVIIYCYVIIGPEEVNEKDKLTLENDIFDYPSSACFCCSRSWLRITTFIILIYRLIVANLEVFSDFCCYDGFHSLEPGLMVSDFLTIYFIIEQVATLVAFYGLCITESKILKCYVMFQLFDLVKQTITFAYPILMELPDRGLEPPNFTKMFINKNIHDFRVPCVYLFLASFSIVVINIYVKKLQRSPIIVESFETIGLVYKNSPNKTRNKISAEVVR